jgi:hypothetical protein
MLLKLDDDFVDEIVRQSLMDTYIGLRSDLNRSAAGKMRSDPEDVEMWVKVATAIEVLGEWYFVDFNKDVLKRKKEIKNGCAK